MKFTEVCISVRQSYEQEEKFIQTAKIFKGSETGSADDLRLEEPSTRQQRVTFKAEIISVPGTIKNLEVFKFNLK